MTKKIRKEGEAMDKKVKFTWDKDGVVQREVISYDPPKDDYYRAEIKKLQQENEKLRNELSRTVQNIGCYEKAMDYQGEVHDGIIAEYKAELAEKDDEIIVLKGKIEMLEKAIVNGALREVLA